MPKTKKITLSALLVALATVLMLISKLLPVRWLQGGSITIASMVPIIAVSLILGTRWGTCASVVYALIQMVFGFYPPPAKTFVYYILCIMLDYVIAFGVLGTASFFYKLLGKTKIAAAGSTFIVTFIRYICHILSGALVWGVYAPKGQSVWIYTIVYNGTYMIPEIVISVAVIFALYNLIIKHS